jgi:hypothetical protein
MENISTLLKIGRKLTRRYKMIKLYAGEFEGKTKHSVISKEYDAKITWKFGDDWRREGDHSSLTIEKLEAEADQSFYYAIYNEDDIKFINKLLKGLGIEIITEEPIFRAELNQEYWFVNDCGGISTKQELNDDTDNNRFEIRNYFRTPDLARQSKIFRSYWY